jgi:P-type Ca2+ transporter type 2C
MREGEEPSAEADIPDTTSSAPWHSLPAEEVLSRLEADEDGLSSQEAKRRLAQHGPNALFVKPPVSLWQILVDQLRSLIILLLVVATGVAMLLGDHLEAAAIAAVLLVTVAIGFWVEWQARRAVEALSRMQLQSAVVLRDGERRSVDARELVPGDVIVLEAGTSVPADARLLSATELRVVEAPLTGESVPVGKTADAVETAEGQVPLGDRVSMVFKGTVTAAGAGTGVVVATGAETEIGIISELVQETRDEKTPLEERLDVLGGASSGSPWGWRESSHCSGSSAGRTSG